MKITLTNRYIPAILILAVLAIGNFFINDYGLNILDKHGEIINKSGRQRMISQKALLLVHMYINHEKQDALVELKQLLDTMKETNNFLASTKLTPELKQLYFTNNLKKDIDNFIQHLYNFINNPVKQNNYPYEKVSKLLIKLNKAVKLHEKHYEQDLNFIKNMEFILLFGILFMLALLVIFIFLPTKKAIESKIKEIQKQQDQIKQKDLDILSQVKNAQMGEMIGNIAHQWRQPLSAISTAVTGMIVQKECEILDDDIFFKTCNNVNEQAQYLSSTINIFRDYIKEQKELKTVILQDRLNNVLKMKEATFTNNYIKLINNINNTEPIEITMIIGELDQVIINIINNAKDILEQNNIEKKWIKIDLAQDNNCAIITIEDNGGGVPKEILPKIFDPYFTTKHQSQGTGLGLHMSKDIIEKSLKGSLKVKNSKYGAMFIIKLPLG